MGDNDNSKTEYDRLHSTEDELTVLAIMLEDPSRAVPAVLEGLPMGRDAFGEREAYIFDALLALTRQPDGVVNTVTLAGALRDVGQDPTMVAELAGRYMPSALATHIGRVRKFWMRREMRRLGFELSQAAVAVGSEEPEAIQTSVEGLSRLLQTDQRGGLQHIADSVREATEQLESVYERRGRMMSGLATGFVDIDRTLLGMEGGQFIVIAGRPSMGKTALLMNIAEHVAVGVNYTDFSQAGVPVAVFSLEMTTASLASRMLMGRAGVNLLRMRDGFLTKRDLPKLSETAAQIGGADIYVDETPSLTLNDLRARATLAKERWGIRAVFVDYLQLMRSMSQRSRLSRQIEVGEISAGLKALAKELDVPVLTAAQLNRNTDGRKDNKPQMSDLRESGSIEQDADIVGLLYRPDYYGDGEDENTGLEPLPGAVGPRFTDVDAYLDIAKQRNGPTGVQPLIFRKELARFLSTGGKRALYEQNEPKNGTANP